MKKNFIIFLLAIAVISIQSCGSKSEKENEAIAEAEATPAASEEEIRNEKEAKAEKEQEELVEKRKKALEEQSKISLTYKDKKGNIVYNKAEIDPSFEGGNKAMMKYLKENLIFPQSAQDKGLEGSVFVDFVVSASGDVREVEVTEETSKSVDQSFRDEAMRVVISMPNWVPGRQRGENVDVRYSIPITFRLI